TLIADLTGGIPVASALDVRARTIEPATVSLRVERIEQLLGHSVSPGDVRRIVEGIGGSVTDTPDGLEVTVPTHRPDILREVDLIEEVARVNGYDRIPTRVPRV